MEDSESSEEEDRKKLRRERLRFYCTICVSEICGTAILIFVSCLGAVPNLGELPSHFQMSLVCGGIIFIIIQIFGHISGSHINPTVTISAMIFGLVTVPAGILYILSQFIGAFLGYGTLIILVPSNLFYAPNSSTTGDHRFCTTVPNPKLTIMQAFALEFLANIIFVLLCWGIWDRRSQNSFDLAPIKFGLTVLIIALSFGGATGPSLNTARSFAPALITGTWKGHWIYWIAPICAAVFGSIFYRAFFLRFRNPGEPSNGQ